MTRSPSPEGWGLRRDHLRIAIGLVLLLSPVLYHVSPLGGPAYAYEARRAEPGASDYDLESGELRPNDPDLAAVECDEERDPARACAALDPFLDDGVVVDPTDEYARDPDYVRYRGRFYEWNRTVVADDRGFPQEVHLSLDPASATKLFDDAAHRLGREPRVVRRAVRGETVRTYRKLPVHGRIVTDGGRYWVVYRTNESPYGPPWLDVATKLAALVGPVVLVWPRLD